MTLRVQEKAMQLWLCVLLSTVFLLACAPEPEADVTATVPGLSDEELAIEPPQPVISNVDLDTPVSVDQVSDVTLEALAEVSYTDQEGRQVVDVLEQDFSYLAVRVTTQEGRPVQGAAIEFSIEGSSRLLEPGDVSEQPTTNEFGIVEFAVVGGQMGMDRVTIEYASASTEILVNVISLKASGFPALPTVEGGLPWADLMRASVRYEDDKLVADFPQNISARGGETVKLSGFMMPLDPDLKQRRFLLTSNPPSCFYHVPGGPAGAVEVFAPDGIDATWDPIVLEGRFEPQTSSNAGVVYRLHEARLVTP